MSSRTGSFCRRLESLLGPGLAEAKASSNADDSDVFAIMCVSPFSGTSLLEHESALEIHRNILRRWL